jgi:hypothetical protein
VSESIEKIKMKKNQKNLKLKQCAWFIALWLGGLFSISIVAYAIKLLINSMK